VPPCGRRRILAALLCALGAVLVACFVRAPASAAALQPMAEQFHGYTYDNHHRALVLIDPSSERGPPARIYDDTTLSEVDDGLHGASARTCCVVSRSAHDYDSTSSLVQVDHIAGSAGGAVQAGKGVESSLLLTGVAANTGSKILRPSSLADELAQATGGVVKANKDGYTVNIPHGSRGVTVRVMERGGSRTNYYRVSVPGKETYTVTGEASMDANLTHIDIGESSLDDILSIVARIQGGG
jgi:hypothetical protein